MAARVVHASYHKGRYEAALKCFSYLMETAVMTTYKIDPIVADLVDRKSTRLNSSHIPLSRMPSSA